MKASSSDENTRVTRLRGTINQAVKKIAKLGILNLGESFSSFSGENRKILLRKIKKNKFREKITSLNLSGNKITTHEVTKYITCGKPYQKLTSLKLTNNNLQAASSLAIKDQATILFPYLKSLDIRNCQITHLDPSLFSHCPNLQDLFVSKHLLNHKSTKLLHQLEAKRNLRINYSPSSGKAYFTGGRGGSGNSCY